MAVAYEHKEVERKWQQKWAEEGICETGSPSTSLRVKHNKCYVLDMFPYPSGEGLHVGHPKGYIATDVYSRMKKMQGCEVLHPMGWDAFGLPAENYAIKNKVHPRVAVEKNIKRFKEQLSLLGFNYDWSREINTTDPEYYKWTQWIFLQMFKRGLAYQSHEPINWCPSCETGLANEDLDGGRCERCGTIVEKKPMRQWVLKITDYAERLLEGLEKLDWPESIKESQRNWIGKSEGLVFTAPVRDTDLTIQTFSTHFEAFYADTFVVIAPDHPFLPKLVAGAPGEKQVLNFSKELTEKRLKDGYDVGREPEGIFTGRYIVDPVGNGDLPIWVASYALADYGTGIVKCSAHDERDFAFAKKYGIRLRPVLFPEDPVLRGRVDGLEVCYADMKNGLLSEPREFAGKRAGEHRVEIAEYAVREGFAEKKVQYRLKDWVFSRQRYWGEPIPIIHCEKCGVVPVPEDELPVKLPEVERYEPTGTGESPLANIAEWVNTECPKCKGSAKRETNTMPQWAGSSWYYIAYAARENSKSEALNTKQSPNSKYQIQNKKPLDYWLPVDMYVGGAEHATRHLIYARFWHKFLFDIGVVSTDEPFSRLQHVGLIGGADGRKMSKRYGNVVNPDDIVERFGADALRLYEMFLGPFDGNISWSEEGILGPRRFLEKIWRYFQEDSRLRKKDSGNERNGSPSTSLRIERVLHKTIKKVTEDIEGFRFNTAISALMILFNELEKCSGLKKHDSETFLRLLAPFAPHMAEELYQQFFEGTKSETLNTKQDLNSKWKFRSIHLGEWPKWDEKLVNDETVQVAVQVNGKTRGAISMPRGATQAMAEKLVKSDERFARYFTDVDAGRVVFVPDRLINFLVQPRP